MEPHCIGPWGMGVTNGTSIVAVWPVWSEECSLRDISREAYIHVDQR